ncbi:MAG: glycosyltransferase family 2 protein [Candidatus Omnitrophica bacterium]|nr:glycosyltransferase family 2 protein [Candidatus Omnitrophota bacterium]
MAFFSVIVPTYNRKFFLKIAIESILSQTFEDYEIIIIDDGSTDKTELLIKDLIKKSFIAREKIKYIYQEHKGVSFARNLGVMLANGKFICFLDSDDRYRQNKLEVTFQYIKKYPTYKIFHTEEIWYRNGQLLSQKKYHKKPTGYVFKYAVKMCCISISTVAIKKEIFDVVGKFDENLPACEDYDFWLRVASKFKVFLIPQYLTIKEGGHPDQQSKKYPALDRFRIYALKKILESKELDEKNYKIAFEELKNKCKIYIEGALKRKKLDEVAYYQKFIDLLAPKND